MASSANDNGPNTNSADTESKCRSRKDMGPVKSFFVNGIFAGIVSGLLVTFSITATGHATGVLILQGLHVVPGPSCVNPQWLLRVPDDQILANSYYAALDTFQHYNTLHTADLTVDGNVRTAWLQWSDTTAFVHTKGPDYGNWISWSFSRPYDIRLVCILNGWTEDKHTYDITEPVKSASIGTEAPKCYGKPVFFQPHGYAFEWQPVKLTYGRIKNLCLDIHSVYSTSLARAVPGPLGYSHMGEPLTGISEVQFYYSPDVLDWAPY